MLAGNLLLFLGDLFELPRKVVPLLVKDFGLLVQFRFLAFERVLLLIQTGFDALLFGALLLHLLIEFVSALDFLFLGF